MPALAFGLKPGKFKSNGSGVAQKRKAVFVDEADEEIDGDTFTGSAAPTAKSSKLKLRPISADNGDTSATVGPPRKSPKLSTGTIPHKPGGASQYTNLSALRSAKLQDAEASKLDASVYDYDAVYETLHVKAKRKDPEDAPAGPKYMTSLMTSAETRKRDQLRAREKLLQKERENEGEEFADKEQFVTGAYKKAQEEMRKIEEEEKRREEEEEERRRKGGGMEAFNRGILQKEEERQRLIEQATEEAQQRKERGEEAVVANEVESDNDDKLAANLNKQGARIAMNEEGEILDKRQLLSAGLNFAPKKQVPTSSTKKSSEADKPKQWQAPSKSQDARASQRERQSRMMERQIEEMTRKQEEAEQAEKREIEEKNKSKVTEDSKTSARERFLQRKREREEEAKKKAVSQ